MILGSASIGKTTLIHRYIEGRFQDAISVSTNLSALVLTCIDKHDIEGNPLIHIQCQQEGTTTELPVPFFPLDIMFMVASKISLAF